MSTAVGGDDLGSVHTDEGWGLKPLLRHAVRSHRRLPGIRKIPLRALGIIGLSASLNVVVWIAAAIVLVCQPVQLTPIHWPRVNMLTRY